MLFYGGITFGQSYRIGDLYTAPDGSQGIVFYVNPAGNEGWVVALWDDSFSSAWGGTNDIEGITNYSYTSRHLLEDTSGYTNTLMMREAQNPNSNYVAWVVPFANGWYLPSSAQLRMLFTQLPIVSPALISAGGDDMASGYYWSSTENSSNSAWMLNFSESGNGSFSFGSKTTSRYVRSVRTFYNGPSYEWSNGAVTSETTVNPSQTTTYTVTVSTSDGCSGSSEHTIEVLFRDSVEISRNACDTYVWDGNTYYGSGDFIRRYERQGGCDSIVTLHLTLEHTPQALIQSPENIVCAGDTLTLHAESATSVIQVPAIAIGDILCEDGSFEKPSAWPVEGKVAKGIVFYVDDSGEHGWAVHLDEYSSSRWSTSETNISALTDYSLARDALYDNDGYGNTQKIRNAGSSAEYPAAWLVDFEHGWYLPSIGQLRQLFSSYSVTNNSLNIVGGTPFILDLVVSYWSSNEYDDINAWRLYGGGTMAIQGKSMNYKVRSICTF